MKTIFVGLLLMIAVNAVSQKSYRAIYKRIDTSYLPFTINEQRKMIPNDVFYYLYFNDSFSYMALNKSTSPKAWKKTKDPDLLKISHHEILFDRYKRTYYYGVAYPDKKDPYFIKDTFVSTPFFIDSSVLQYKEWRCKEAYAVLQPGDTVFALLAIDYPYPYSPINGMNFPFLPLELYYPLRTLHLQITLLEPADDKLYLTPGIPIISMEESKKRREHLNNNN